MIRIIDNTLMAPYDFSQYSDELYRFCELLFIIGVDVIELPVRIFNNIDRLPSGNYMLNVSMDDEAMKYPGFYRYSSHRELKVEQTVVDLQINDIREIISLINYQHLKEVRIVGMDDLLCHSYEKLLPEMIRLLPNTVINFCPEDTYHCASALAVQWLLDYGKNVTCSFAGCRNNAATEEVLMALRLAIRHKPNRDLTILPEITTMYEKFSSKPIGKRKAIIGKNIFQVEAGIHVDGLHKNPVTYEPYSPHCVGGKSELVIGKHSGSKAIQWKAEQLNLPDPKEEVIEQVLDSVRHICTIHRSSLSDDEFARLLLEVMEDERNQTYC